MLDVKGREIRTSKTKEQEGINLKFGDKILVRSDNMEIESSETCIQIDCHAVLGLLREGDELKFGQNAEVFGEVEDCTENQVKLVIKGGGVVKSNSPVKIPGIHYQRLPILRAEDHENI